MKQTQRMRKAYFSMLFLAVAGLIAAPAWGDLAADKALIKEQVGLDGLVWQTEVEYRAANLVVTGPDGFRMERAFKAGDSLFLDFASVTGDAPNGLYQYELTLSPKLNPADRALAKEARALGEDVGFLAAPAAAISGVFSVVDGAVVDRSLPEPDGSSLKLLHADNVYIDGSLCVGFDCVNGAAFGFDTIRLQENNLRIKFDDTSVAASFPRNDWQITINDSANGGQSKFSVDDITNARTPFTIEANARSNSLYVDDGGRIGIRTSTPSVEIHVIDGDTPTLRLQQDGSSGFAPQTWDVAGNETNFFIRDVTNGSTLPLRIRPGADSSAIFIDVDNSIGLGTSSPAEDLHLFRSDSNDTELQIENSNAGGENVGFRLVNSQGTWRALHNGSTGDLVFNQTDDAATEMTLDADGNLTLQGNCSDAPGGGGCTADYVFEEGYERMSLTDLESFIHVNKHLPNVPSESDINTKGHNMRKFDVALLEKVEELVLYTIEQHKAIEGLKGRIEDLNLQLQQQREQ